MTFFFETCVVAAGADGILSIALINTDPLKREDVLVVVCGPTAGAALAEAIGSALRQRENGNDDEPPTR